MDAILRFSNINKLSVIVGPWIEYHKIFFRWFTNSSKQAYRAMDYTFIFYFFLHSTLKKPQYQIEFIFLELFMIEWKKIKTKMWKPTLDELCIHILHFAAAFRFEKYLFDLKPNPVYSSYWEFSIGKFWKRW